MNWKDNVNETVKVVFRMVYYTNTHIYKERKREREGDLRFYKLSIFRGTDEMGYTNRIVNMSCIDPRS